MRTIVKTAIALGFAGAMAAATTAPASAQGFYFNAPGIHLQVGQPDRQYYGGGPRYYDYAPGYAGPAWQKPCAGGFTVQDGVCKPYRGY